MGCDYPLRSLMASQLRFNPRTHMGCDMMMIIVTSCSSQFQSTHPHGVRRQKTGTHTAPRWFQSTHPHGVRPSRDWDGVLSNEFQSTHPHGVRRNSQMHYNRPSRFQSTHPHGVRLYQLMVSFEGYCFNPRTHMGCDGSCSAPLSSAHRFQSTHPHGVRRSACMRTTEQSEFQSTHPHGVRLHGFCNICKYFNSFNPRTHMGCDCIFSNRLNITMQR